MTAKPPRRPDYGRSSRFPDETPRSNDERFMGSLGDFGPLSDWEWADLNTRVDQFHDHWKADGSVSLESFLPPLTARHRPHVVVELIKTDMELRAEHGLPVRVETYLGEFRADLPAGVIPVSLLVDEYHLRHKFADKPSREEYRQRFPRQFAEFERELDGGPPIRKPQPPQRGGTIGPENDPNSAPPVPKAPTTLPNESPASPKPRSKRPATKPDGRMVPPPTPGPPIRPNTAGGGRGPKPDTRAPQQTPPLPVARGSTRPAGSAGSETPLFPDLGPEGEGFAILRQIGKGAFGTVYEAEARGGRPVAIKCVDPPTSHRDAQSAFQSEMEALQTVRKLSHNHLLDLHQFWVAPDGRLVIVMRLAECTLADRIEHHRKPGQSFCVPPEELIGFMEEAADALDYLHENGITHRDVKPQNLLYLKGSALVADMGLARGQGSNETIFIGGRVGTPHFMAPEVWTKRVSYRSDQYSLAATYVNARLGRPLFDSRDPFELSVLHASAIPDLSPIPADEQAVLLKALAKKSKDRYPNCAAFMKALRAAVFPPLPSTLPPPPLPPQPSYTRWLFLGMALLLCGLVVGGFAVVQMWLDGEKNKRTQPTTERVIEQPPPRKPWRTGGWQAASNDPATFKEYDGKFFAPRLIREVAGQKLVAVLVEPTRPGDKVFYILENKITNKVFSYEWDAAVRNPASIFNKLELKGRTDLILGGWKNGALGMDGNPVGIGNEDPQLPVVGVTPIEAMIVAHELGGMLPTYNQWLKALGVGDGDPPGPTGAQPEGTPLEKQAELARRRVALGLTTGRWPVGRDTTDWSFWKIHQLLSNGQEWLDDKEGGGRFNLAVQPSKDALVTVVGQPWTSLNVTTFDDLRGGRLPMTPKEGSPPPVGFRIVLEP